MRNRQIQVNGHRGERLELIKSETLCNDVGKGGERGGVEKPLDKAAKLLQESWSIFSRDIQ